MTEPQLRALFREMAEGVPAASRVNPALARRRGRARLRWRRAGVAGTSMAAAAVAVTVTLAVGLSPLPPGSGPAAAGPVAPRQFNPLVPYLSFGWLPAGESFVGGSTGQAVMSLTAAPSPRDQDATWDLSAYAAGACKLAAKRLTCFPYGGRQPLEEVTARAPAVHGHPAFWSGSGLVWQYAHGGWARLIFPYPFDFQRLPKTIKPGTVKPGTTRATVKHDAIKIASHLQAGAATRPLVFPAQLTGVPGQWRVSGALYLPYGSVLRARTYTLNAAPAAGGRELDAGLTFQDNLPSVEIDPASTHPSSCSAYPKKNRLGERTVRQTLNGHRVIVNYQDTRTIAFAGLPSRPLHGQSLCTGNADGLAVHLSENGAHPALGVASLFKDHLRLLGTNPAHWTAKPIG